VSFARIVETASPSLADHYSLHPWRLCAHEENSVTFTKTAPPEWLLAMWKEIYDKNFGGGFDCFGDDAVCNLGVADWHGREGIRQNLREVIDKGVTTLHDVLEYWDRPSPKVCRGKVTMTSMTQH